MASLNTNFNHALFNTICFSSYHFTCHNAAVCRLHGIDHLVLKALAYMYAKGPRFETRLSGTFFFLRRLYDYAVSFCGLSFKTILR